MNLAMLKRIRDDGQWKCGGNGGLKGVEWASNTTPDGGTLNPTPDPFASNDAFSDPSVPSGRIFGSAEAALQVHHLMQALGDGPRKSSTSLRSPSS